MQLKGKKAVVTGGAGFIGSHLVDRLISLGNDVVVIDDFSSGSPDNIKDHEASGRLTVIEADIFDEQAMLDLVPEADCLFHLACRNVRLSLRRPTNVHDVNATGTLNMLKAATKAGIRRFFYCSSSEVNGTADIVPMPEDYHFKSRDHLRRVQAGGEYYTQVYQRAGWLETVIVRPHNNYGPREHFRGILGEVIPRFILFALAGKPLTIYGDGLQTRDFTYVVETADYMTRIMECDEAVGGTFNLCRGNEVSILQIAEIVSELVGGKVAIDHLPARPSDVLRLFGDPSRMRERLGSSPEVDIEDGLRMTYEWFKDNIPLTPEVFASMESRSWEETEAEEWLQAFEARKA